MNKKLAYKNILHIRYPKYLDSKSILYCTHPMKSNEMIQFDDGPSYAIWCTICGAMFETTVRKWTQPKLVSVARELANDVAIVGTVESIIKEVAEDFNKKEKAVLKVLKGKALKTFKAITPKEIDALLVEGKEARDALEFIVNHAKR